MDATSNHGRGSGDRIMSREDLDEATLNDIARTCNANTQDIEDVYACTPVQLGIMADSLKQPGAYMFRLIIAIAPHVDLDRFCAAIQAVVERESMLRTRVVDCSCGIVQVILRQTHVTFRAPPSMTVEHYLEQQQARSIGLGEPLLLTAIVDQRLIVSMHHVMGDGYTNVAMMKDVAQVYRGQSPNPHTPFKEFVKHYYSVDAIAADRFWAARLQGYPAQFPQLPSDSYLPTPTQKTTKTVSMIKPLSKVLIPLYIEAAWAVTVWNYTGETAVSYGMVLSGRTPTANALETTLGPTVETFPVSVVVQRDGSVQDLLKGRARERRQVQSDSMRYGMNAIRSINDETRQACRFQTLLNIMLQGEIGASSDELTLEVREGTAAPFALCLDMFLLDHGRLVIEASSDPTIIDDRQLQRILNQYEHNLTSLIRASPESSLAHLPWLNPNDRVEILGWNEHVDEYSEECLHERFRKRARECPSRSAVECHDGRATYTQLDSMTDRVAVDLQCRGVELGSPVVFMFEKSFWTIVAVISILKAGGVCVPIDTSLPHERKGAILALSKAKLVLTSSRYSQGTPITSGIELIVLDNVFVSNLHKLEAVTKTVVSPRDLAYLQFTSGSTGVPKGVQLEHGNLVSGISTHADMMRWEGEFRVLQFAAHGWDVCVLEIWGALMFGGTVCIPDEETRFSGLAGFIAANDIHWAFLTPTVTRTLSPSDVPSLRTLVSGGEQVDPKSATTWGTSKRFINSWNPCESGWNMTVVQLTPQSRYIDAIGKPVGCAVWLTKPENCNELVPIGSVGELIIEGPGVACGYADQPEQTAASFISPPSWAPARVEKIAKGRRFYRTGDLGRYCSDGTLIFVGRQDDQVKIRGQRFELGEVESSISACAAVRNVFATVYSSAPNQKRLVAVVSLTNEKLPSTHVLRQLAGSDRDLAIQDINDVHQVIQAKLPSYMLPSVWYLVERLPLAATSKLDRKRIRQWLKENELKLTATAIDVSQTSANAGPLTPPKTDAEKVLQSVWSSVLELPEESIGLESSFIQLGGDSILAMQAASRCLKQGFNLMTRGLLQNVSLAVAAATHMVPVKDICSEDERSGDAKMSEEGIERRFLGTTGLLAAFGETSISHVLDELNLNQAQIDSAYPCLPIQDGILMSQLKGSGHEYMNRFAFKINSKSGQQTVDVLKRITQAWQAICDSQPVLRTIFTARPTSGGGFFQIVLRRIEAIKDCIQIERDALLQYGDIVESLRKYARPTFNPGQVPHRLTLFSSSGQSLFGLLDISHAIIDAKTLDILRVDLHRAFSDSTPLVRRPDLASYVVWTQRHQKSSQEYWRSKLKGARPCIVTSRSTSHHVDPKSSESQRQLHIPFEDFDRLAAFCKHQVYTISNVMLFAWAMVLQLVTGAESPCFGFTYSGRDVVAGAEQIMGPLLSLLVGCVNLKPNGTIDELLQMISESTGEAMAHPACSLADISQSLGLGTAALFNTLVSVVHLSDSKKIEAESDYDIEDVFFQDPNEYALSLKVGYSKDNFRTWIEYQTASISDPLASHVVRTLTAVLKSVLISSADQTLSELINTTNAGMQAPTPYSLLQEPHVTSVKKKAASQCELPKSYIEDIFPCTPEQLVRISRSTVKGASPGWRVLVLSAAADVQLSQLCQAFDTVESLVPALRTRIVSLDSLGIYQIVHLPRTPWVEEDSLKEYLEGAAEIPVRYGGPLCQFARIESDDGPCHVVLSMHPAVCDDKTFDLVTGIIGKAYNNSKVTPLDSLSLFVDYSMHRRASCDIGLEQSVGDAAIWPFSTLSAHHSGHTESTKLTIKTPCEENGIKLEAVLQAAWALCLAYRTSSSKVAFGFSYDKADHLMVPRIDSMSGPTSARAICTLDLSSAGITCQDLFSLVSEATMRAASVASSIDEDQLSFSSYGKNDFPGTRLDIKATTTPSSSFYDLKGYISLNELIEDSSMAIKCYLNGHHIAIEAITRGIPSYQTESLLKQYEHFILQLTSQSNDTLLSKLIPLCSSEIKQLQGWNSQMPEASNICVHEHFRRVVERYSFRTAVCAWDHKDLSYTELDQLSNGVAWILMEKGVGVETIVPYLCEKSALAPVLMLGILKAGGALLPLDAAHPIDRLTTIVQDCAAPVVLTSPSKRSVADKLPTHPLTVSLKMLSEGETGPLKGQLQRVTPSNACYVVYTSGSTGKPKGIVVSHRNAATFFRDFQGRFGITHETRALQVLNFIFDASIGNMLCTLMHGGAVCLPSEEQLGEDMGAAFRHFCANFANMTPTQSSLLQPEDVTDTLQILALGGEPLPTKVIGTWIDHVRLVNVYGPSETTVWSSSRDVSADGENADSRNIGHAAGCRYWVVQSDNHDRLVPIGCPGELLIEGPLVARGYLNDPQKTATVFLDRPPSWAMDFPSLDFKERFYKSGDLVVQNPLDGSIFYLDRKDTQIKLRGQRIELGEIEHHLAKIIDDAGWTLLVELVQPNGQDQTKAYLAVFYTLPAEKLAPAHEHPSYDSSILEPMLAEMTELRQKTLEFMPEYMVPSVYYRLRQIPRTASGKTDRKFLRQMAQNLTQEQVAIHYVSSHTETPQPSISHSNRENMTEDEVQGMSRDDKSLLTVLKSLWTSVLPVEVASISDQESFFRLGGNSATAIHLVAAARDKGYSISVAQIFRNERLVDQARVLKPIAPRNSAELKVVPFSLLGNTVEVDSLKTRTASLCGVEEAQIEDVFPCTPLQEGLMAMSYKRPGDYMAQIAIELTDAIDADLLSRAWQDTVSQMPILRTCMVDLGNEGLVQVVLRSKPVLSAIHHMSTDIENASSEMALQSRAVLGSKLTQMYLVHDSSSGKSPCLFWTAHHAIYDGWTLTQIFQTLERAYYGTRQPSWTPFQHLVKHSLEVTKSEMSKKFWRDQFSSMLAEPFPTLPSPTYSPHADSTLEYKIARFENPKGGFTKATAIRAAWSIVQASYNNASDVIFGVVVSGRQTSIAGIESLAGPTISTVPLRLPVDPKSTADQFLSMVQQQALDMIEHEQMGLQNIQKLSPGAADACRFQTLLLIQPEKPGKVTTSGLYRGLHSRSASDADAFKSFSNYALLLVCQQYDDVLDLQFVFDSKIIQSSLVSRMSRRLEAVLGMICIGGSQQVSDMMDAGTQDLNDIWNWNASVPPSIGSSTHDLIAQTMAKQPLAPAVAAWDGNFTYQELDMLSHRLALHLKSIGVVRDTVVPLCFEKSLWMPVATLAVMRAGGVCVAMDVSLPRERLLAISKQVTRAAVLASPAQGNLASAIADGAPVVSVDQTFFDALPELPKSKQELPIVTASDRLYICFTSGSTGVPKGVVITHGNFSSALKHQAADIGLSSKSRVFDFASYSVDMSWYNLLHALYAGACLCVPSHDERLNDVSGATQRLEANWICATPTIAGIIDDRALEYLRSVELFGELGNADLFAKLKSDSERRVRSAYGPTECTGLVTGIVGAADHANIGRGVGGVTWIVGGNDASTHLVPVGGIGELWIEGPLVALGYLGNAEKTAAAFVEDPPWLLAGSKEHSGRRGRLYRTGDLVKYNEDGTICFLGRNDGQIKIRGQRVELLEVEHYLRKALVETRPPTADGQVDRVTVEVVTPKNMDRKILAAFIVPHGAVAMTEAALSDAVDKIAAKIDPWLAQILPHYMLPDAYIPLQSMPPASNSKRDRRKLQELGAAYDMKDQQAKTIVSPTNATEAALCQIWSDVLRCAVDEISIEDSFSNLGGDSVAAMRIVSRCRQVEVQISMDDLLRLKTVKKIAGVIDSRKELPIVEEVQNTSSNALNHGDIYDASFELSPIQQFYFDIEHSDEVAFVMCRLLCIPKSISKRTIEDALYRLVSRHDMLRARFKQDKTSGKWSQHISTSTIDSFLIHDVEITTQDDFDSRMLSCIDSLDIENGPLVSVMIGEREDSHLFFVAVHHIIADMASVQILMNEFKMILAQKTLPPPPPSFQQWIVSETEYAREHLTPRNTLPFTFVQPPQLSYWNVTNESIRSRRYTESQLTLDPTTSEAILGRCNRDLKTHPVDLITAALMHSFHQTFPDRGVPPCYNIGLGRETCKPYRDGRHPDMSNTIGWFSTISPVQMSTSLCGQIDTAIDEAKAHATRHLPNRGAAYFLSRYYHINEQDVQDSGNANDSEDGMNVYEVQLNYQAGFSPQHDNTNDDKPLPSTATNTNTSPKQKVDRPIQQLPLPHALEQTMSTRFIPWSIFAITVPPIPKSQDGRPRLKFVFEHVISSEVVGRWTEAFERSLGEIVEGSGRIGVEWEKRRKGGRHGRVDSVLD